MISYTWKLCENCHGCEIVKYIFFQCSIHKCNYTRDKMLGRKRGNRIDKYVSEYVVFDLETTGISPNRDEVVEISAIKVREGQVVEEFTTLVNPKRPIPYGASAVNHITDEMVADAPYFSQVLMDFFEFIGDMVLVGHNIQTFDMNFIYRDAEKFYGKIPDNDYIDTLRMARNVLPALSHHRLVDLSDYYGISTEGAHRALNDCRMNMQVYELLAKEFSPDKLKEKGMKICPRCKNIMKKRNGRYGEFWGCSGYPNCRYTEDVL